MRKHKCFHVPRIMPSITVYTLIFRLWLQISTLKNEEKIKAIKTEKNSIDKIHFIAAGESDAILIESNGRYGLVDTSNVSNSNDTLTQHGIGYIATWNGARVKTYLNNLV